MRLLAAFSHDHRRLVAAAWIITIIAAAAMATTFGSGYKTNFTLPGTESQRAVDLLQHRFPQQSGDAGGGLPGAGGDGKHRGTAAVPRDSERPLGQAVCQVGEGVDQPDEANLANGSFLGRAWHSVPDPIADGRSLKGEIRRGAWPLRCFRSR